MEKNRPINQTESLLAIDAALLAYIDSTKNNQRLKKSRELAITLSENINDEIEKEFPNFGTLITAQKNAVVALSRDTRVFGN
jgi:UDP-3-O-[3-hydroxymyristoyl] glucosamine N-acyltransferase